MRYCTAGGGQLYVIFLDRKMKMNREAYNIIILGSGSLLDLLFYGMEISNYSFNICGIYDEKDEILSYRGISVSNICNLNELKNSEIDFVFNCLSYRVEFEKLLMEYFSVEKVKRLEEIEVFLTKKQRMEFLKKRTYMESKSLYEKNNASVGEFTYGVPAHYIKHRFDKKTIEKLLEIKWWDWDYEKIYDAIPLLQSGEVDQLINEASKDDVVAFND